MADWQSARVLAARALNDEVRLLELAPERAAAAAPGSHIDVGVEVGGRPAVRSYSLLGGAPGRFRIAVKRLPASRGGSAHMHRLVEGTSLPISAPVNNFALSRPRPAYVLLAGGIGITALHAAALALAAEGAAVTLLHAVRRRADLVFGDELRAALGARYRPSVGAEGGRVDVAATVAGVPAGAELYVCGPLGMLEVAKRAWAAAGRPPALLRFETFGNSGRFPAVPFTVRIPRLGREVSVSASQSLLEALEEAGIAAMSDCRRGECGLCAVSILEWQGEVDHRDVFFSAGQHAANAQLCACVSRVWGDSLVIDTSERP